MKRILYLPQCYYINKPLIYMHSLITTLPYTHTANVSNCNFTVSEFLYLLIELIEIQQYVGHARLASFTCMHAYAYTLIVRCSKTKQPSLLGFTLRHSAINLWHCAKVNIYLWRFIMLLQTATFTGLLLFAY